MAAEFLISNYRVLRVTLTDANTEYSQALTNEPARITISSDDLTTSIRFSFTSGASGTGKRVFGGSEWSSRGFIQGGKTLYLQSPNAGAIAVIEEYRWR